MSARRECAVAMQLPTTQAKVEFLSEPKNYPEAPHAVRPIETHFAWVFLTDHHAYKLKKPILYSAIDYRTLEARERGCSEELRLNRRLAPNIYLSMMALTSRRGALSLGGPGTVADWLIKMRRLPAARMMDRILAAGGCTDADIERLVQYLADFYARAIPVHMEGSEYLARVRAQVLANRDDMLRFTPRISVAPVNRLAELQLAYISGAQALLIGRGALVVEGHGDLRAEHVCLDAHISVIDCLEFSRDLRLLDPLDDLALLALEIERLGQPQLAQSLLQRFNDACRAAAGPDLLHFYLSLRAATRAKVAAWHLEDHQFKEAQPWIDRAHSLLENGERHAQLALAIRGSP